MEYAFNLVNRKPTIKLLAVFTAICIICLLFITQTGNFKVDAQIIGTCGIDDRVTRDGGKLMCNGSEFKFIGVNMRELAHLEVPRGDGTRVVESPTDINSVIEAQLIAARDMGATVVRIFAAHQTKDTAQTITDVKKVLDIARDVAPNMKFNITLADSLFIWGGMQVGPEGPIGPFYPDIAFNLPEDNPVITPQEYELISEPMDIGDFPWPGRVNGELVPADRLAGGKVHVYDQWYADVAGDFETGNEGADNVYLNFIDTFVRDLRNTGYSSQIFAYDLINEPAIEFPDYTFGQGGSPEIFILNFAYTAGAAVENADPDTLVHIGLISTGQTIKNIYQDGHTYQTFLSNLYQSWNGVASPIDMGTLHSYDLAWFENPGAEVNTIPNDYKWFRNNNIPYIVQEFSYNYNNGANFDAINWGVLEIPESSPTQRSEVSKLVSLEYLREYAASGIMQWGFAANTGPDTTTALHEGAVAMNEVSMNDFGALRSVYKDISEGKYITFELFNEDIGSNTNANPVFKKYYGEWLDGISFNWGTGNPTDPETGDTIPIVGPNNFSARWTGIHNFTEEGNYILNVRRDDGVRVWIDFNDDGEFNNEDERVFDGWTSVEQQDPLEDSTNFTINLNGGESVRKNIKVEFRKDNGNAFIEVSWVRDLGQQGYHNDFNDCFSRISLPCDLIVEGGKALTPLPNPIIRYNEENNPNPLPPGWEFLGQIISLVVSVPDNTSVDRAFEIKTSSTNATVYESSSFIHATPGDVYTISSRIKTDTTASRAEVYIAYYDENYEKLARLATSDGKLAPVRTNREWQELSKNVTIPTKIGGKDVKFAKIILNTSKNSEVTYDDIHFAKNKTPNAVINTSHTSVVAGDRIQIDARESTDFENDPLSYDWFLIDNGLVPTLTLDATGDSAVKSIQLPDDLSFLPPEGTYIKVGVFVSDGISDSIFRLINVKVNPGALNTFTVRYVNSPAVNNLDFETATIAAYATEIPGTNNPKISHNWGTLAPHPDINANNFAAQWKGNFTFPTGGNYTFVTKSDQRVRLNLLIDTGGGNIANLQIINNWKNHLSTVDFNTVSIPPGNHTVILEYYEYSGPAEIELSWGQPGEFECTNESAPLGKFCAAYYKNRTFNGLPTYIMTEELTRTESPNIGISHLWGTGGPGNGIPNNNFSVEWVGKFNFEAGDYLFTSNSGDGMRIYVDDELVVDNWGNHGTRLRFAEKEMSEGEHIIRVEYYEYSGDATAEFFWDKAEVFKCSNSGAPLGKFCAAYYNNRTLSGLPTYLTTQDLTRTESPNIGVSNLWGTGGPGNGIPNNNFSAEWRGRFNFENGKYLFTSYSGDGMRIYVDDELIVDNWKTQNATLKFAEKEMTAGEHIIKVEYYEYSGDATAEFFWDKAEAINCTNEAAPLGSFCAEFYNNRTFTGLPTYLTTQELTRTESPNIGVSNLWGTGGPGNGIPDNHFSAKWIGKFNFDEGEYIFTSNSSDGMRMYINDELVVDNWGNKGTPKVTFAGKEMTAGEHIIKVEYYEYSGDATAEFFWDKAEVFKCTNRGAPIGKFCAGYYNNRTFTGLPTYFTTEELTRTESPNIGISHIWGTASPNAGIPKDNFSVQWIGKFNFDDGKYIFTSNSGDGMRIYVDDELVVDNWGNHGTRLKFTEKEMAAGEHIIRVDYYEYLGNATAEFFWDKAEALVCHPTQTPTNEFCVEYYSNTTLTGFPTYVDKVSPTVSGNKTLISNNWFLGSPDVRLPSDKYSIKWEGKFDFDYDVYTFTSASDDGMKIYLDDTLIVNNWGNHTLRTRTADKLVSAGTHTVRVEYYDNINVATANFSWENDENDNTPPEITNYGEAPTSIYENTFYEFDLNATDADSDTLTYTLVDGPTSIGMTMNTRGLIRWTTPQVSTPRNYNVEVKVEDGKGGIATYSWVITVMNKPNSNPVITNGSLAPTSIYENTEYYFNLDAIDADGDTLIYTLVDGPASLGMTIGESNGIIRWTTPSVSSTKNYRTEVSVTDGNGGSANYVWVISVLNRVNRDPVIHNRGLAPTSVQENQLYVFDVSATDPDGDTLTYSLTDGPTSLGMGINPASGYITWVAPSVSSTRNYRTEVSVTDGKGGIAIYTWVISVRDTPVAVYPYGISSVRTIPSSFTGQKELNKLFDNITNWPNTSVIYHNPGSLTIDIEFAATTTLRGLNAYIAGQYAGNARYKWSIYTAPSASGPFSLKTGNWITNNEGFVHVPIPSATGKVFRIVVTRDNGDGVEHVLELAPVF